MLHVFICSFYLGYFVHVFETNGAQYFMAGFRWTLVYTSCFLDEIRGRRGFGDEMESTVGLDCDKCWCWCTWLYVGCSCIELFAEIHRLHATSTKSRSYGWSGCCFASSDEETLVRSRLTSKKKKVRYYIRLAEHWLCWHLWTLRTLTANGGVSSSTRPKTVRSTSHCRKVRE